MRRFRSDEGAYAVLYSILVVMLLGMASLVVDISMLRADKRDGRSAADFAALAGASDLGRGPFSPRAACNTAWAYSLTALGVTSPASPCTTFPVTEVICPTAPTYGPATATANGITITVVWPVPSTAPELRTPDGLPSGSAERPYDQDFDGSAAGCDRLGVSIRKTRQFGLAAAIGFSQGDTVSGSVARFNPEGGPKEEIAALNVLNPNDCSALRTTGGGRIIVGPTLNSAGNPIGPGLIAVESLASGPGSDCSGQDTAIDAGTGNNDVRNPTQPGICASSSSILTDMCDGLGIIQSHALDPGGNAAQAYSLASYPNKLRPVPSPEGGIHGWKPVTSLYGCNAMANCDAPATNYIRELVNAYGPNGTPATVYGASQAPYAATTNNSNPYPAPFVSRPELCVAISTIVIVPAGNNYANCNLNINNGGVAIIQGGTLVVDGGITIASGGCLVINTLVSTCPTAADLTGSGATVTTAINPVHDAIVFVRGCGGASVNCFENAGTLVAPQTFVYAHGDDQLIQQSSGLTLWTAPGAGATDSDGNTTLERDCGATATAPADVDCLNSRFARLTYWSERTNPSHTFNGQGNLNVVGVFFTPRAFFNITGGSTFAAAAAQFWADTLDINGGARLGLSPFEKFGIPKESPLVTLIR